MWCCNQNLFHHFSFIFHPLFCLCWFCWVVPLRTKGWVQYLLKPPSRCCRFNTRSHQDHRLSTCSKMCSVGQILHKFSLTANTADMTFPLSNYIKRHELVADLWAWLCEKKNRGKKKCNCSKETASSQGPSRDN